LLYEAQIRTLGVRNKKVVDRLLVVVEIGFSKY
jgi:hypothetical protein